MFNLEQCISTSCAVWIVAQSMNKIISASGSFLRTACRSSVINIFKLFEETQPLLPTTHRTGGGSVANFRLSDLVKALSFVNTNCGIDACSSGSSTMHANNVDWPRLSLVGTLAKQARSRLASLNTTYPFRGCTCRKTGVSSMLMQITFLPTSTRSWSHRVHFMKAST